jgi:hypothetical protein
VTTTKPAWRDTENEKRRQQTQAAREALAMKHARKISLYGLEVVDTNSPGAVAVLKWRDAMIDDLGGVAGLSAAKLLIIEQAVVTALAIKRLDQLILQATGALVSPKDFTLAPFVLQRQNLIDSFTRQLRTLGLERRAKQITPNDLLIYEDVADDEESATP